MCKNTPKPQGQSVSPRPYAQCFQLCFFCTKHHARMGEILNAGVFPRTTGWHCSSSLIILSSLHHSRPSSALRVGLRLLILCRGKIRIAGERSEDYQIDIGDNLFLLSLLHGLSLHFPLLSASVTHSRSVVNLCFHPLPFKSLIASGYIGDTGGGLESRGTCTNNEKKNDTPL